MVLVAPLTGIPASRDSGKIVKPFSRDQLSNALEFRHKDGVSKASSYLPPGFHTLTMHLTIDGAAQYIKFLKLTPELPTCDSLTEIQNTVSAGCAVQLEQA